MSVDLNTPFTHKKKWGVDWGPGYQLFECWKCQICWKEVCRDYTSPSRDICPVCHSFSTEYIGGIHKPEWKVDRGGNLIDSHLLPDW
jgi:hypothetical protein